MKDEAFPVSMKKTQWNGFAATCVQPAKDMTCSSFKEIAPFIPLLRCSKGGSILYLYL